MNYYLSTEHPKNNEPMLCEPCSAERHRNVEHN